jgi:hypothetical protein
MELLGVEYWWKQEIEVSGILVFGVLMEEEMSKPQRNQ